VLLSDTVGFIRNLPTTLVRAFRATLEEVAEAALVLHVVDVSSPSSADYAAHVMAVLAEIGAAEIPQVLVMNKTDRLPGGHGDADALARRLAGGERHLAGAVAISAVTGDGIGQLLEVIDKALPLDPVQRTTFRIPAGDGAMLALLHEYGRVLKTSYSGNHCVVEAEVPESLKRRLERFH